MVCTWFTYHMNKQFQAISADWSGMFPVSEWIKYKTACIHVLQCNHRFCPSYLSELLHLYCPSHYLRSSSHTSMLKESKINPPSQYNYWHSCYITQMTEKQTTKRKVGQGSVTDLPGMLPYCPKMWDGVNKNWAGWWRGRAGFNRLCVWIKVLSYYRVRFNCSSVRICTELLN